MRKSLKILLSVFIVLALMAGCGSGGSNEAASSNGGSSGGSGEEATVPFYEGQTFEVIVPFGSGGGTDTFGRFISSYIGKFTEGSPSVQVVNRPGGGSVNGANEFVQARKHDGLTALLTSASTHAPYLLGEPAVEYDLKKMKPVLGLPTGGVVYISPDTGYKEPKDLLNTNEDLIYAGISATGLDLVTLLSFEVLGTDVEAILGYDGRGPSRVAFEQGESNIDYQTSSAFIKNVKPLVDEGKAIPLFAFGHLDENGDIIRDPAFPDTPSIKEFYEEIHGGEPSGQAWDAYKAFVGSSFTVQKVLWIHNNAPAEAYTALKAAGEEVANDPEFNEKAKKSLGAYKLASGDKLEKMVSKMLSVKQETLDWVKNFLVEKYDVQRLK